ncbi:glycosyltransferase 87 family protein [Streptomyces diastaticus]|uniref:glycosyltransferase 87 family protein n=1 Tax=Streptomyces diastaticus TaxID=1956 RepID=UPI00365DFE09
MGNESAGPPSQPTTLSFARLPRSALVLGVTLILAAFAVGLVIRNTIPGSTFTRMDDLRVYYAGGEAVLNGAPLYDFSVGLHDLPFTYPPFAGLLFTPLAILPLWAAEAGWAALNVLALGWIAWIALGLTGVNARRPRLTLGITVAASLLGPVLEDLWYGEINVLLMLLILIDFQRRLPPQLQGIALGIAAGIKLIPLIFIVYLLLIGRTRAALQACLTFAGTILAAALVLPAESRQYWLEKTVFRLDRMLNATDVNYSLYGLIGRLSGTPATPPAWTLAVAIVTAALGLFFARRAYQQGNLLLGVVTVGFTSCLVSPVAWLPNFVWAVPAFIWLAHAHGEKQTLWPPVVFGVGFFWFTLPLCWYGNTIDDGPVPYQTTAPGNLLGTLGSPTAPVLLALLTMPLWLPRLRSKPDIESRKTSGAEPSRTG